MTEEEAAAAAQQEVAAKPAPPANPRFWDCLLKDHHTELEQQRLAALGRGHRRKPVVRPCLYSYLPVAVLIHSQTEQLLKRHVLSRFAGLYTSQTDRLAHIAIIWGHLCSSNES